jgi:AraC family transcriptional regulator, positive regulator of tynA and feaB
MATVFSTLDVHPRERLSYWRDTMRIVPHEFTSSAGFSFRGTVCSGMLDDILVSEFYCDPCEVRCSARNIAQSDCDDFLLCVQLGGVSVFSQLERQAVTAKGSFVLLDPRRPFSVSYQGCTKSVSLKLPRNAFEARLSEAAAHSIRIMDVCRPLVGLTSGFLSLLPSHIDALERSAASPLAEQTLDLIALAFSMESGKPVTLASSRAVALYRLKAVIEAQLCDPALKPAAVASAAGVSIRYANVLLSQEGSSIERYILRRRLERARRTLEDPNQAQRLVSEIAFAWGFRDLSHFARKFRIAYGLTPGDCRRRAQERAGACQPNQDEEGDWSRI